MCKGVSVSVWSLSHPTSSTWQLCGWVRHAVLKGCLTADDHSSCLVPHWQPPGNMLIYGSFQQVIM